MLRRSFFAALLLLGRGAHAALPPGVADVLADLAPDALLIAGMVLAGIVSVYAFKFIAKSITMS